MYSFKYYDKWLHVPYDDDLFLIEPTITMGANQSWTVSAKIMDDHPYISDLKTLRYGLQVFKDGTLISRCRLTEFGRGIDKTYKIFAEDKLAALNDSHCRPFEFTGSPEELFAWFIDNHNSQVADEQKLLKGSVTVSDPNDYIVRSWDKGDNTWSLVKSRLTDTLGGYLVVRYEEDGDYLDWLEGFDLYSDQKIRFGENLLDLEEIIDATETYTACIPYGAEITINNYDVIDVEEAEWEENKYYLNVDDEYVLITSEAEFESAINDGNTVYEVGSTQGTGNRLTIESVNDGKDYIINEMAQSKYGTIYAPTDLVTWDDVTRPENLLAKVTDWLNNDGIMTRESITLTTADLSTAGVEDVNSFEMYQNVFAIVESLNLNRSYLITGLKVDAGSSDVLRVTVGDTRKTLSSQLSEANKQSNAVAEKVDKIEAEYATNEKVASEIEKELIAASSQILQTAEEITIGILSGYTKAEDLDTYKTEIENLFKATKEGFSFEFSQLSEKLTALGTEVSDQKQYIRLIEGKIYIGNSESPITTVYTENGLEIRFNGQMVARYTNEVLEVRNVSVDNQVAFFDQWAIRQGAYIDDVGYNLNDVWIGG